MSPPSVLPKEPTRRVRAPHPSLGIWTRLALGLIVLGLVGVFALAAWLEPYNADGTPRLRETHRQLGFPRCTFYELTGKPCPSCGMTSSFALLVHGDPWNSLRANAAGTLLAGFCLAVIPWGLVCAARGRLYLVRSLDWPFTLFLLVFVTVMLLRWALVLCFG